MKQLIDNVACKRVYYRNDRVQSIIRTSGGTEAIINIIMDCGMIIAFRIDKAYTINEFYEIDPPAIAVNSIQLTIR